MWILREYTRRARIEHFCDYCCNWIQPGMTYTGKVWVEERGHCIVLKCHNEPACPPGPEEIHKAYEMDPPNQFSRDPLPIAA